MYARYSKGSSQSIGRQTENTYRTIRDSCAKVWMFFSLVLCCINCQSDCLFRFKIDRNYVGEPPAIEITITNLNDNIDKQFLKNTLQKCGTYDELHVYYHPSTKKHLGLARIVFESVKSAKNCISKFNGTSVMGKVSFKHIFVAWKNGSLLGWWPSDRMCEPLVYPVEL